MEKAGKGKGMYAGLLLLRLVVEEGDDVRDAQLVEPEGVPTHLRTV
jgi:hypothetical protein